MRRLRVLLLRMLATFRVGRHDAALDDEATSILQLAIDDQIARGLSAAAAIEAARRQLGSISAGKDAYRDQRGLPTIDALRQDLRIAARGLARTPALALLIVGTMSIAIGTNATLYSVVDAVLLRPLPFASSDRLVWISEGDAPTAAIGQDLATWSRATRTFAALHGITSVDVTLSGGEAERVRAVGVTGPLSRAFGLAPVFGRDFNDSDFAAIPARAPGIALDGPSSGRAAIIGNRLFRTRFGGDRSIVGRPIRVGRIDYTVVGVASPEMHLPIGPLVRRAFGAPIDPDLLIPIAPAGAAAVIGRLEPGVTVDAARAELTAIRRVARPSTASSMPGMASADIDVVPLRERLVGSVRRTLFSLGAACTLVLLIACVNVAGLLTARGASRRREFAVRAALGAGRARIVRLLFVETMLMTSAGAAGGLALAWAAVRMLRAHPELAIPRLAEIDINPTVVGAAIAVCALSACIAALAPGLLDASVSATAILANGGRISSPTRRRLQQLLVVAQVALALILLTAAGLMVRSLAEARSHGAPLAARSVLSARVEPSDSRLTASPEERRRLMDTIIRRIQSIPGVSTAALWNVPYIFTLAVHGVTPPASDTPPAALWVAVSPDFGPASGVPLRAGRWLTADDVDRQNVVVSDAFLRALSPVIRNPAGLIGRQVSGPCGAANGKDCTIVGVVQDFRTGLANGAPLDNDAQLFPQVFFSHGGRPSAAADLLVRTSVDPLTIVPTVKLAFRDLGGVSLVEPRTLADQLAIAIAPRRFQTAMLTTFAAIAVFLAAIGIAGLLAYTVTTHTREIGVRVAIGAQPRDVLRLVAADGARFVVRGVVIGWAGAALLARLISGLLYRVPPFDAASYGVGAAVLLGAAAISGLLPALRAVHIDPVEAMRHE